MDKATVLVIDGDADLCGRVTEALEGAGYRVVCVSTPPVLQIAAETRPDVILLDDLRPVLDGATVSELLRAYAPTAHIPIVAISVGPERDAPLDLLYDAWLDKPFAMPDLFAAIERIVAGAAASR